MALEEMTLTKVREEAKKKLMGVCGVYKICDGDAMRICQGQILKFYIKKTRCF